MKKHIWFTGIATFLCIQLLICSCVTPTEAPPGLIQGQLLDKASLEPLAEAEVELYKPKDSFLEKALSFGMEPAGRSIIQVKTDSSGSFTIRTSEEPPFRLWFKHKSKRLRYPVDNVTFTTNLVVKYPEDPPLMRSLKR